MASFWEQDAFGTWDVVVVGGGITGLSTALSLKEAEPSMSVAVLERGWLPTGATTRSAGFACTGSPTELLDDVTTMGWSRMVTLVERRWAGLDRLRARLGDEALDLSWDGGWELLPPGREDVLEKLDALNEHLMPVFGAPPFILADPGRFGFPRQRVAHLVHHRFEGGLHPGRLARALMARSDQAGVQRFSGAEVRGLASREDGVEVVLPALRLRARRVAVCTNAFAGAFLPELEVTPGRGQVLLTAPLEAGDPLQGVFHMDAGYVYFRGVGDRVLIGGARNLDPSGERTTDLGPNPRLHRHLEGLLAEVVLPGRRFEIAHLWSGIMGFGSTREPLVQEVKPGVLVGIRLGGMGIALGSAVGDALAHRCLEGWDR